MAAVTTAEGTPRAKKGTGLTVAAPKSSAFLRYAAHHHRSPTDIADQVVRRTITPQEV
ncbi:hypothetical protein [Streptomyces sp. A0592]|uniref:hypothetical protein n=1 Tax=Streptomyces sp. A0592 TaxID=2563099 RepID=UPI00144532BA|nr:hypothetical protein [Streptomyces sp. A0592]